MAVGGAAGGLAQGLETGLVGLVPVTGLGEEGGPGRETDHETAKTAVSGVQGKWPLLCFKLS